MYLHKFRLCTFSIGLNKQKKDLLITSEVLKTTIKRYASFIQNSVKPTNSRVHHSCGGWGRNDEGSSPDSSFENKG